MKLKPKAEIIPENIFVLREDALPTTADMDPWGKIMVWRKDIGWSIIHVRDVMQFIKMKHTHWTYTPDFPYNKSVTEL